MGLFGKSFQEQVDQALEQVRSKNLVRSIGARVDGKVVTLTGVSESPEAKGEAMALFNSLVETENTLNQIRVERPVAAAPVAAAVEAPVASAAPARSETAPVETVHEVVRGDTLSALAKRYLGSANRYMDIFNANKDQLTDPDKIQVGQKLRIPGK